MLRRLREYVEWSGMIKDVKKLVKTCNLGCAAAVPRTEVFGGKENSRGAVATLFCRL